jgi:protein ImuA
LRPAETPAPALTLQPAAAPEPVAAPLDEPRRSSLLAHLPASVASSVWVGDELGGAPPETISTGFPSLDLQLPGGGWPLGVVSELLLAQPGTAEWRLLLPGLAMAATPSRPLLAVSPPLTPFVAGLRLHGLDERALVIVQATKPADRLWAAEQAAKAEDMAGVIAWLPQARPEQIRRLQTACHNAGCPLFVVRHDTAAQQSSPAPLRVQARSDPVEGLAVHVLKRRGAQHDGWLILRAAPAGFERLRLRTPPPPSDRHAGNPADLVRPVGPLHDRAAA